MLPHILKRIELDSEKGEKPYTLKVLTSTGVLYEGEHLVNPDGLPSTVLCLRTKPSVRVGPSGPPITSGNEVVFLLEAHIVAVIPVWL